MRRRGRDNVAAIVFLFFIFYSQLSALCLRTERVKFRNWEERRLTQTFLIITRLFHFISLDLCLSLHLVRIVTLSLCSCCISIAFCETFYPLPANCNRFTCFYKAYRIQFRLSLSTAHSSNLLGNLGLRFQSINFARQIALWILGHFYFCFCFVFSLQQSFCQRFGCNFIILLTVQNMWRVIAGHWQTQ